MAAAGGRTSRSGRSNGVKTPSTPEQRAYNSARTRCNNPNNAGYSYYGGRGIEFRFKDFDEFISELGERPSDGHSLDRIDNDGHYEKGNVRWATKSEQMNNRRENDRTRDRTWRTRRGVLRRSVAISLPEDIYQIIKGFAKGDERSFSNALERLLRQSPYIKEAMAAKVSV